MLVPGQGEEEEGKQSPPVLGLVNSSWTSSQQVEEGKEVREKREEKKEECQWVLSGEATEKVSCEL